MAFSMADVATGSNAQLQMMQNAATLGTVDQTEQTRMAQQQANLLKTQNENQLSGSHIADINRLNAFADKQQPQPQPIQPSTIGDMAIQTPPVDQTIKSNTQQIHTMGDQLSKIKTQYENAKGMLSQVRATPELASMYQRQVDTAEKEMANISAKQEALQIETLRKPLDIAAASTDQATWDRGRVALAQAHEQTTLAAAIKQGLPDVQAQQLAAQAGKASLASLPVKFGESAKNFITQSIAELKGMEEAHKVSKEQRDIIKAKVDNAEKQAQTRKDNVQSDRLLATPINEETTKIHTELYKGMQAELATSRAKITQIYSTKNRDELEADIAAVKKASGTFWNSEEDTAAIEAATTALSDFDKAKVAEEKAYNLLEGQALTQRELLIAKQGGKVPPPDLGKTKGVPPPPDYRIADQYKGSVKDIPDMISQWRSQNPNSKATNDAVVKAFVTQGILIK